MILRNLSYEEFAKHIAGTKQQIVLYGAGMIGKILAPYILKEYNLEDFASCYIDGDKRKLNQQVELYSKKVSIFSLDKLKEMYNFVLLVTNSNFEAIISMLDKYEFLDDVEVFILPIMQLDNLKRKTPGTIVRKSEHPLIPKKIHYCWFSRNPIPDNLKRCIESWEKFCPDYKIICWNEDNYDFEKIPYMKQAYENKKWGFIPDYARLDIVFLEGGIYLDTDVELIRNLDDLLYQPAFCGVEKWGNINTGGCFGAVKGNTVVKEMRDFREKISFLFNDGSLNLETCGYYETFPLIKKGMQINGDIQCIESMTVYSPDFFHPYDYMSEEIDITANTFSIHHFNGGWLGEDAKKQRMLTRVKYKKTLERMQTEG